MSSILTNTSAMVALQTLKSVNSNLQQTQSEISTGKSVASARDNSAVWAISKVMESDVKGFQAISESLSLGESTVAVARNAAETVTDLLTEVKGKIVAAQEENVDRAKIQTDIDALRDQISSVVNAAQFNGLNLVKGSEDVNILSSLDRSGAGEVSAANIKVARQDLTASTGEIGTTGLTGGLTAANYGTINGGASATGFTTDAGGLTATVDFAAATGAENFTLRINGNDISLSTTGGETQENIGAYFATQINALGLEGVAATDNADGTITIANTNGFEGVDIELASTTDASAEVTSVNGATPTDADKVTIEQRAATIDLVGSTKVNDGDTFTVTVGGATSSYIAGKGETMEDVAKGLKTAIDSNRIDGISTAVQYDADADQWSLAVDDANGDGTSTTFTLNVTTGGVASGGLFGLNSLDVTTNEGANAALDNVETLIQNSIDSAASFGSVEGRIETQSNFVSKLMDSLTAGIGTLVDADMEEASARLQALQVQQQLATQSLSIANQAPQNILSLFR
ncbi:flagellin [Maritalea mobilis]|uniref:flagellin n=1 Tax=Maritalea mobilis TaxID=483324 RepID=UPI001C9860FF|nr:flagellin [Maritalea mobilis]MBY6201796.1 flagellin [Maritalea mobilis]